MYGNVSSTRPLSIKFALLSAAVGAGFAAPAYAGVISTAPAGFTPVVFSTNVPSSYAFDVDGNGSTDYTIESNAGLTSGPTITGENADNQIDSFIIFANGYETPSDFLSANSIKGSQSAALGFNTLTSTTPYAELVFMGDNSVLTRGYIKGYGSTDPDAAFTLVDFGLAPEGEVPEPGSLALLAAGAAGIGALRRRRKARAL